MRGIARRLPALLIALIPMVAAAAERNRVPAERPTEGARLLVRTKGAVGARELRAFVDSGVRRVEWSGRLSSWHVVRLDDGADPSRILARLRSEPFVTMVEEDRSGRVTSRMPDDLREEQWSLDNSGQRINGVGGLFDADIDAPEAWELTTGSRSVKVALLDTGITAGHPDLAGNLIPGVDLIGEGTGMNDTPLGHGTAVAGIVAARGDNGRGIAGVNWESTLLPVKVCDGAGRCPFSSIIAGIETAVLRGARIINLSVTCDEHQDPMTGYCGASRPGACRSEALRDSIEAAGRAGVLVVTSAGNCGESIDDETSAYPCAFRLDNLICVAASDARDELAAFSNHGPDSVSLAAPGADIVSLSRDPESIMPWDGTSFSAPLVTGVAALLLARNGEFTAIGMKKRLTETDRLASLADAVGGGTRLNARGSIESLFLSPRGIGTGGPRGRIGDFNGDGLADAISTGLRGMDVAPGDGSRLRAPETWFTGRGGGRVEIGDVDGDGMDDLVRAGRRGVEVLTSGKDRFAPPSYWNRERVAGRMRLADVDGDGLEDLVESVGSDALRVRRSSGTAFLPPVTWGAGGGSDWILADVDGDRRADLVSIVHETIVVSMSNGSEFLRGVAWSPSGGTGRMLTGDVDADGRADVAVYRSGCWDVFLSEGDRFSPPRPWACGAAGPSSELADMDGDGRADLIRQAAGGGWEVSRSSR